MKREVDNFEIGQDLERRYPGISGYKCLFTVLVITFNRAHLLRRAIESVWRQGRNDIEIVVVDDGSTDETRKVVENARGEGRGIPVRYIRHENMGKPASYNAVLDEISGYFTIILDDDDILADTALSRLDHWWNTIPVGKRLEFAGVEGLCVDSRSGEIMGGPFPRSPMDSNFLETRYRFRVSEDKRHIVRTHVMREFPFPLHPGEREMPESVVWCRMAHRYRFRYVNEVVQYCEQHPTGLTARVRTRRLSSPNNFRLASLELLNQHCHYMTPRDRYRIMVRYIRHSFVANVPVSKQLKDLAPGKRMLWFLALMEALPPSVRDRWRRKNKVFRTQY